MLFALKLRADRKLDSKFLSKFPDYYIMIFNGPKLASTVFLGFSLISSYLNPKFLVTKKI